MPESHKNKSLKNWAEDDKPREKMMLKGEEALSDAELLAIVMGSGNREETAVDLAKRILGDYQNNWHELAKIGHEDLCKYKGIGDAKAISILAVLEIGRRRSLQELPPKPVVNSASIVFRIMHPILGDAQKEEFWVLYLNQANKLIAKERESIGGLSSTQVDVRTIMKKALGNLATGIILVHNHPSGNITPSQADRTITEKIKNAGDLLNITALDHVIISQTGYYSFADKGLL